MFQNLFFHDIVYIQGVFIGVKHNFLPALNELSIILVLILQFIHVAKSARQLVDLFFNFQKSEFHTRSHYLFLRQYNSIVNIPDLENKSQV